mmetsp:Transcript_36306/g.44378  ORF Transcript_36306/g.44378 Transcript_36306/m.44378 type:complete len:224 (+) Transcript_36306:81-752(+)
MPSTAERRRFYNHGVDSAPAARRGNSARGIAPSSGLTPQPIRARPVYNVTWANGITKPHFFFKPKKAKAKVVLATTGVLDVYDGGVAQAVVNDESDDDCSFASICDFGGGFNEKETPKKSSFLKKGSPKSSMFKSITNGRKKKCRCYYARLPCTCGRESSSSASSGNSAAVKRASIDQPIDEDLEYDVTEKTSKFDVVIKTKRAHEIFDVIPKVSDDDSDSDL